MQIIMHKDNIKNIEKCLFHYLQTYKPTVI